MFCSNALVAVPMKVLVSVCWFLYTVMLMVLLGPGVTLVSRNGMEPSGPFFNLFN